MKIKFLLLIFILNSISVTEAVAKISTNDRCKKALEVLGVDTSGSDRGWVALCVGLIHNEPITRYGNWYGPGYWGGDTALDKAGLKAPVDSLDEVAMRHDYGYVIAEKYGKIYGKKYEYKLKALADKIAVRDSINLPKDPRDWDKRPADIEKAARYRDRIITGFIIESDIYKDLEYATKTGDAITSPLITLLDKTDYSHIPDSKSFEREVTSHINGWKKEVAEKKKEQAEKALKEKKQKELADKKKAAQEKEKREAAIMKKLEKESDAKRAKDAREARERLRKKIEESKKEQLEENKPVKKSYEDMTPEERREALKKNDPDAWKAIEQELLGSEKQVEGEIPQDELQSESKESSEITPVKLSASFSFDEDYSAGEFKNIVTTTMTLSFWNVGSQLAGYGGATMKTRAVASLNGATSEGSCGGTFSGGPNGVIRLAGDCAGMTFNVRNGRTISIEGKAATVSNPAAFQYWEK